MKKIALPILAFFICLSTNQNIYSQVDISKTLVDYAISEDSLYFEFHIEVTNNGDTIGDLRFFDQSPFIVHDPEIEIVSGPSSVSGLIQHPNFNGLTQTSLFTNASGDASTLDTDSTIIVSLSGIVSLDALKALSLPAVNTIRFRGIDTDDDSQIGPFVDMENILIPAVKIDKTLIDSGIDGDSLTFRWELALSNCGTVDLDSIIVSDALPFNARIIDTVITMQPGSGQLVLDPDFDGRIYMGLTTEASGFMATLAPEDTVKIEVEVKTSKEDFILAGKPVINEGFGSGVYNTRSVMDSDSDTLNANTNKIDKLLSGFSVENDTLLFEYTITVINLTGDTIGNLEFFDESPFPIIDPEVILCDPPTSASGLIQHPNFDGDVQKSLFTVASGQGATLAECDTLMVKVRGKISIDDLQLQTLPIENIARFRGEDTDGSSVFAPVAARAELLVPIIDIEKALIDEDIEQDSLTFRWQLEVSNKGTVILDSLRLNDNLPFPARIVELVAITEPTYGILGFRPNYDGNSSVGLITSASGDTSYLDPGDNYLVELEVKTAIEDFFTEGKPVRNIGRAISIQNGIFIEDFDRDTLSVSLLRVKKELVDFMVMEDSVMMNFQFTMVNKGTDSLRNMRLTDNMPFDFFLKDISIAVDQTVGTGIVASQNFNGDGARNLITPASGMNSVLGCRDSIVVDLNINVSLDTLFKLPKPIENIVRGRAEDEMLMELDERDTLEIQIPIIKAEKSLLDYGIVGDSLEFSWQICIANIGTVRLDSLRATDRLPFPARLQSVMVTEDPSYGILEINPSYTGTDNVNLLFGPSGDTSYLEPGDTFKIQLDVITSLTDFILAERPIQNISRGSGQFNGERYQDFSRDTIVLPLLVPQKEFVSSELTEDFDSLHMCFRMTMINAGTVDFDSVRMRDMFPFDFDLDSIRILKQPEMCNLIPHPSFSFGGVDHLFTPASGNDCKFLSQDTIVVELKITSDINDITNGLADTSYNRLSVIAYSDDGNIRHDTFTILPFVPFEYTPSVAGTKAYTGKVEEDDEDLILSFEFELVNTGNCILDSLSLLDTLHFLPAALSNPPYINVTLMDINANVLPGLNPLYDGYNNAEIFDSTGILLPGESFKVILEVGIDPYSFTELDPALWFNQAIFSGIPKDVTGAPLQNPDTGQNYQLGDVSDLTDDGTDLPDNGDPLTNNEGAEGHGLGDNDMDDPTPINICETNCEDIGMPKITHLSLGEDCEALITASMLSDSVKAYCDYYFDVEVYDEHYQLIPDDIVDMTHLGMKVKVVIREPECGNETWGEVLIEDKMPPVFEECINDTISCIGFLEDPDVPDVSDNCGVVDTVLFTQVPIPLGHCDEDFIAVYERTWIAYDYYGNSDTCVQLIYLERIDLDQINGPANVGGDDALECNSGYLEDENGNPSPVVTGSPTYNGVPLYSEGFEAEIACNINVDYEDKVFPGECVTTIMRTWTVYEWCYNEMEEEEFYQMIEIKDTTGPEILNSPQDQIKSTGLTGCGTYFTIPLIEAEDNCQTIINVLVQVDGIQTVDNGAKVFLEMGEHEIIYEVADKCGNVTYDTMNVIIEDNRAPQAICIQESTIQLDAFGYAKIHASNLDNRSFDQCSEIEFKAKRMEVVCNPSDTIWGNEVYFCCADAGKTVMVAFMVVDEYGNENQCMVNVNVSFKFNNPMICPPDMEGECGETYVLNDLGEIFGEPEIKVCPEVFDLEETQEDLRDNCGLGEIIRHFYLKDLTGNLIQYCSQTITIDGQTGIEYDMINWPEPFDTTIVCDGADLDPEFLPDSLGKVILPDVACTLTSIKHVDTILTGGLNSDACYKIFRTWKVLDWCDKSEGSYKLHTYEQVIIVRNEIEPTILSSCNDTIIGSIDVDCDDVYIELPLSAEDDCTAPEDLNYVYRIDTFNTGKINIVGTGSVIKGSFPIGVHKVYWEVNDGCGNVAACDYLFEVRNEKQPEPKCKGISLPLTPMYLDMDDEPDTLLAMITPAHIDLGSLHPCGYGIQLSFSEDVEDDTLVFGCGDVGENFVELWVTDEFGNQNFCVASVIVTNNDDTLGICDDMGALANIEGVINDRSETSVEGVEVSLEGSEMPSVITRSDGAYAFQDMLYGGDYTIRPSKDDDVLNGVSTLDLLLIQRHILGLNPFTSAYDYIAADINDNGALTASDILTLRKVILGIYDKFPENTSWRFLDGNFTFEHVDLWNENQASVYKIQGLNQSMEVDFMAIKIGDLSGDAIANSRQAVGTRSSENWVLEIPDVNLIKNEVFDIPVYGQVDNLKGLQLALDLKACVDVTLIPGRMNILNNQFSFRDGLLKISYTNLEEDYGTDVDYLFRLTGRSIGDGNSQEIISGGLDLDFSEVYHGNELEKRSIVTNRRDDFEELFFLDQNAPNPWRSQTRLKFNMPKDGVAVFQVRDMVGKSIFTSSTYYSKGENIINLNSDEIPVSGVLIYEIKIDDLVLTKKMIHLN